MILLTTLMMMMMMSSCAGDDVLTTTATDVSYYVTPSSGSCEFASHSLVVLCRCDELFLFIQWHASRRSCRAR